MAVAVSPAAATRLPPGPLTASDDATKSDTPGGPSNIELSANSMMSAMPDGSPGAKGIFK